MQCFTHEIEVRGVCHPLRCYLPDGAPDGMYREARPAVIVFPGGAYRGNYEGEGEPIALRYVGAGACAFVLNYSVFPAHFPQALLEGLEAVRYVREHAEEFRIDPERIAVCGFSAGGHLAASVGVFWKELLPEGVAEADRRLCRPDKLILCYPVTSYESHHGSFRNLVSGNEEELTEQMKEYLSIATHVDADTPPTYIWHNWDDRGVPVEHSLNLAATLCHHGVPTEVRVYPSGGHGTCLGNYVTKRQAFGEDQSCAGWVEDTLPFLYR